jgi:hypothetical protein
VGNTTSGNGVTHTNAHKCRNFRGQTARKTLQIARRRGPLLLSLGVFPEVKLAEARELRDEARRDLRKGVDFSAKRRIERLAGGDTFEAIAREWFEKFSTTWAPGYSSKVIRRLEICVFPWLELLEDVAVSFHQFIGFRPLLALFAFNLVVDRARLGPQASDANAQHKKARRIAITAAAIVLMMAGLFLVVDTQSSRILWRVTETFGSKQAERRSYRWPAIRIRSDADEILRGKKQRTYVIKFSAENWPSVPGSVAVFHKISCG